MAADERESHDLGGDEDTTSGTSSGSSHPVGTGVGAAGGAVAGAAMGMMGGPLGMAVGGVAGAVVGGMAGRAAAEAINPAQEEEHWRQRYSQEPYYEQGRTYDDYGPAYRYGMESRARYQEDWDTAASRLESGWSEARGSSSLDWREAQPASRAAWERAGSRMQATPGSSAAASSATGASAGSDLGETSSSGTTGASGIGAMVGEAQSAGENSGDREDILDALEDLVECCKDGEYGFHACAENAKREDLKTVFEERAQDCRRGADELQAQIRQLGGNVKDSGSALGAVHRGWVSVKSTLTTYDDKATLEDAERGEDNALARYRKALQKPLPTPVRELVERQLQGVQRNHDQIKMLRNQFRAGS